MEGLEENRKEIGRDGAPPPTARHRSFWRGMGTFAIVLACVTTSGIAILWSSSDAFRSGTPKQFVAYFLRVLPLLWLLVHVAAGWQDCFRAYCLARAETTEQLKLFDYLWDRYRHSEAVRRRVAKRLYQMVWGLFVTLLLLALYGFLSTLW